MTITIERETLLSIANDNSPQCPKDPNDRLNSHLSKGSPALTAWGPVSLEHSGEYLPYRITSPIPDLDDTDDDSSCYSYQSFTKDNERRVCFSFPLVTEVRTRPRTRQSDLKSLFYSYEETQRFRQAYRLERKLLASQETESSQAPEDNVTSNDPIDPSQDDSFSGEIPPRITRCDVRYKDSLETFYDGEIGFEFDNDSFWNGSITWY